MSTNNISFIAAFSMLLASASIFAETPAATTSTTTPAAATTTTTTAPAATPASTTPDISGSYNCKYHDPASTPPDSTETITLKKNLDNTYKVTMTSADSVIPYAYGIGTFSNNVNNAFAYLYWLPKTPATTNVEFFMIKPDGSLDGVFAQSNKSKAGTETCTKSS